MVKILINGDWNCECIDFQHIEIYDEGEVIYIKEELLEQKLIDLDGRTNCYLVPSIFSNPNWNGLIKYVLHLSKKEMIKTSNLEIKLEEKTKDYLELIATNNSLFLEHKRLKLDLDSIKKKFEALDSEFQQYKKESIKWSIEDFLMHKIEDENEDNDWSINEQQAQSALEFMISSHDSTIGITWETVEIFYKNFGTCVPKNILKNKLTHLIKNELKEYPISEIQKTLSTLYYS